MNNSNHYFHDNLVNHDLASHLANRDQLIFIEIQNIVDPLSSTTTI
ncbi:3268_t:CDS:2 [Entrophospora sp. SA101]|nr:3268_t:CDS:2 [Entrophospora sp. SA101]